MAWSLLHTDNFNRADANLHGATMSDGLGAWTVLGGSYAVVSNEGKANGGAPAVIIDSAMSAVGDQACEMVYRAEESGPTTRWTVGSGEGTGYLVRVYGGGDFYRIYRDDDSGALTVLATGSAVTIVSGDVLRLESVGNDHTLYRNGSSILTANDATYATGKCGEYGSYSGNASFDDWACYVVSAGTTRGAPLGSRGTAFNGGRTFMGVLR